MEKKRVIIWTEDFYPTVGGTENSLNRQINILKKFNIDIVLITPDNGHLEKGINKIVTSKQKSTMVGLNLIKENYLDSDLIYISRIFKRETLSHLKAIRILSKLTRVVIRIPTLGHLDAISNYNLNYFLRDVHGFICLNDNIKNEIEKYIKGTKIFNQRNGIPLEEFKISKFCENGPFLYAGRIDPKKGIKILMDAWEIYKKNGGKRYLIIIATFRNRKKPYRFLSKIWQIKQDVLVLNTVPNLWNSINGICGIIIPSFKEGHNNTMLEAMASNIPIIASKIPGLMEDISASAGGILFQKGDVIELSKILYDIDHGKYNLKEIGKNGREFVLTNRTIEQTTLSMLRIINS